jgi:transposase-like protein
LLDRAITKAGGTSPLATALGVQPNTPNVWRTRLRSGGTLSPDKRHRLRSYLGVETSAPSASHDAVVREVTRRAQETLERIQAEIEAFTRWAEGVTGKRRPKRKKKGSSKGAA